MKLTSLEIKLQPSYSDNPGKYVAEIEYEGKRGTVKVLLDPDVSNQLLGFIGPCITKFSHKAALEIEQNIAVSVAETTQPVIAAESVA